MSTVLVKNNTELIDLCDPVVVMERTELTGRGRGMWVHRQCGSTDRQGGSVGPQTGSVGPQVVWVHRQGGSVGPQAGSVGPQAGGQCGSKRPLGCVSFRRSKLLV